MMGLQGMGLGEHGYELMGIGRKGGAGWVYGFEKYCMSENEAGGCFLWVKILFLFSLLEFFSRVTISKKKFAKTKSE